MHIIYRLQTFSGSRKEPPSQTSGSGSAVTGQLTRRDAAGQRLDALLVHELFELGPVDWEPPG